jgi:asparagine synthase (glutamine-hydrolysing)
MYRFIALLDYGHSLTADDYAAIEIELCEAGLQHRHTIGGLRLYASKATPVLDVAGTGIVVGHLFSRDFKPVGHIASLPRHASPANISKHLLDHYWGEYLLLQPPADPAQALTALRDPSGGMPCLYMLTNGVGFLTSDISLAFRLKRCRARIDWDGITHRLAYPYLKTQRTGLSGVRELLPGCTLSLRPTGPEVEQTWSPWSFVNTDQRYTDPHEAAAVVRSTVASVVRAWAEADGSILLELSGGLDSSIVAAALCGARARVSCCTLVTPVPGADERPYARLMADCLGIDLLVEELRFDAARFSFELRNATATPCLGGLQYIASKVMSAIGEAHGAVSNFSGGGGDTVFSFLTSAAPAADALRERGIATAVRSVHDLATLHDCTFWRAGRLTLRKLAPAKNAFCEPVRTLLVPSHTADAADWHPWFQTPPDAYPGDRERIFDLSGTQMFRDGAPRGIDRWMRMPLLSQPIVEACLRVPTWMWIAGGRNRAVARSAFSDVLPAGVLNRRSKGTFMSYSGAFYQRNKYAMRDFLLSGLLRQQRIIDADALDRLIGSSLPPRDRSFMRVLELCTTENWLRQQI